MREKINKDIIAIFCADLHLALTPPVWRSAEPDWLSAQSRALMEVENLRHNYQCQVFYAGDIFDRPIVSTELCNWAVEHLPKGYAVAGQHDLPDHRYDDIHKTGFRNLVNANVIREIKYDKPECFDDFIVYGFSFGKSIKPYIYETAGYAIALAHEYVWLGNYKYPTAPKANHLTMFGDKLNGYDFAVFGDNHKGFTSIINNTIVFNCGTFMRRKSDEIDYKPQIGLLTRGGEMIPYYLDTLHDKYIDVLQPSESDEDSQELQEFIKELEQLGETALDFKSAMKEFLHRGGTCREVKDIIRGAMKED